MKTVKKTTASMSKKPTTKKATSPKPKAKMTKKFAKGGVKKYQTAGTSKAKKETPFQQYMKTPGAVASDTVMKTLYPGSSWDAPKSPVAKNPKNQTALNKAFEKTYGQDWKSESGQPAKDETFEQYKRRMGPTLKRGGKFKSKPVTKKSAMVVKKPKLVSRKKK
jgi:hypothetical protein